MRIYLNKIKYRRKVGHNKMTLSMFKEKCILYLRLNAADQTGQKYETFNIYLVLGLIMG